MTWCTCRCWLVDNACADHMYGLPRGVPSLGPTCTWKEIKLLIVPIRHHIYCTVRASMVQWDGE